MLMSNIYEYLNSLRKPCRPSRAIGYKPGFGVFEGTSKPMRRLHVGEAVHLFQKLVPETAQGDDTGTCFEGGHDSGPQVITLQIVHCSFYPANKSNNSLFFWAIVTIMGFHFAPKGFTKTKAPKQFQRQLPRSMCESGWGCSKELWPWIPGKCWLFDRVGQKWFVFECKSSKFTMASNAWKWTRSWGPC